MSGAESREQRADTDKKLLCCFQLFLKVVVVAGAGERHPGLASGRARHSELLASGEFWRMDAARKVGALCCVVLGGCCYRAFLLARVCVETDRQTDRQSVCA